MVFDQEESVALWVNAANRLREVRDAERRFLDLWEFERGETKIAPASANEQVDADRRDEMAEDCIPTAARWSTGARRLRRRR